MKVMTAAKDFGRSFIIRHNNTIEILHVNSQSTENRSGKLPNPSTCITPSQKK